MPDAKVINVDNIIFVISYYRNRQQHITKLINKNLVDTNAKDDQSIINFLASKDINFTIYESDYKTICLYDKIDEQKLYDILDKQKNIFYVRLRHRTYILDPHNVDDKDLSIIKRAFINSNFYSIDAVYVNFKQISRFEFMYLTNCKYLKIFTNEYYYNFDQICEK